MPKPKNSSEPVRFALSFPHPATHLIHVTMTLPRAAAGRDLRMAVWTPGSYLIREYARHVIDLEAADERGRAVPVAKVAKDRWRLERPARTVRYRLYANELTVRTNHLDDTHAFLVGAATFLFPDGGEALPYHVRVETPRGWRVATALDPAPGGFAAPDLDTLFDSPIEVGRSRELRFRARAREHRVALHGADGLELDSLREPLAAIVETAARIFGGLPYRRYLFVLHLTAQGRGGLEHRTSCVVQWPRGRFASKDRADLLELLAHEFFHVWNVKRFRPAGLVPFDYAGENYTPSLWVSEGMTEYYGNLLPRRAGLIDADRYLERLADDIREFESIPGRRVQSLRDSSFDTWIKFYRPHEGSVNATVSYYLKGHMTALALDLEIRRRTRGRRSLDDAMRALDREFGDGARGFTEADVRRALEQAAGGRLTRLFRDVVDGTADPDLDGALRAAGLRIVRETKESEGGWLGLRTRGDHEPVTAASVLAGSPAEAAGICAGDELVALDGFRVVGETLRRRMAELKPGRRARLTLFREDTLREITVRLGTPPPDTYRIVRVSRPTSVQARVYRSWIGG
jgi:predicted metalloprotease with PDZ domain